jgi:hypothetical protein
MKWSDPSAGILCLEQYTAKGQVTHFVYCGYNRRYIRVSESRGKCSSPHHLSVTVDRTLFPGTVTFAICRVILGESQKWWNRASTKLHDLEFWCAFSGVGQVALWNTEALVVQMPNMGIYMWHSDQVQNADSDLERQKLAFWEGPTEPFLGGTWKQCTSASEMLKSASSQIPNSAFLRMPKDASLRHLGFRPRMSKAASQGYLTCHISEFP